MCRKKTRHKPQEGDGGWCCLLLGIRRAHGGGLLSSHHNNRRDPGSLNSPSISWHGTRWQQSAEPVYHPLHAMVVLGVHALMPVGEDVVSEGYPGCEAAVGVGVFCGAADGCADFPHCPPVGGHASGRRWRQLSSGSLAREPPPMGQRACRTCWRYASSPAGCSRACGRCGWPRRTTRSKHESTKNTKGHEALSECILVFAAVF